MIERIRKKFRRDPILLRRIIAFVAAFVIMGCTINLIKFSIFGTDPFTCLCIGLSKVSGVSTGNCMMIFSAVAIIPMLVIARKYVQLGTVAYLFLLGPLVDLYDMFLVHFQIFLEPTLAMRILFFTVGTLIGCLAASLYMCAKIGFICGSIVGIGTFILAFGMGPILSFYNENVSKPLIYGR